MTHPTPIVEIQNLSFSYKTRAALQGVSLSVFREEIFGLLGPNGGGKTTLFRILSTFFPPDSGRAMIHGLDLARDFAQVRRKIGVVFQAPSLDAKLTVAENLMHQGHLYGIAGRLLKERSRKMLERLGLADRAGEIVEKLSGGLKRRVELAKGLLHKPELLILDEPSVGLDPGARIDLWKYLKGLREDGVTILVTTHLMEEAEHCNRIAILNHGRLVCMGSPESLKAEIGGDVVSVTAPDSAGLAGKIQEKFKVNAMVMGGVIQIERERGAQFIAQLVEAFPGAVESVTLRKPTLEDVFIHQTGHRFWQEEEERKSE